MPLPVFVWKSTYGEQTCLPVLAFNATCYLSRTFSWVGFRVYYTKAYSFGNPPTHKARPARKEAHEESLGHGPAGEQPCEDRQPCCSCTGRGCRDQSARVPFRLDVLRLRHSLHSYQSEGI